MASGLPVVRTSNALKSVEIENEMHGLLAEEDDALATLVVKLAMDKQLWQTLSDNGQALAKEKYTREATFGHLSQVLKNS